MRSTPSWKLALCFLAISGAVALAGNTTFFVSNIGDVTFPISPPTNAGATPGAIDNMAIGQTTPAAGSFTSISSTTGTTGPVVAPSITGNDASLGIAGQAAAQGGAVAVVGGTSATTGNAGGASTVTGGTPGATGVGGAVTITSGPGGSTSGAAGAVNIAVGTATSANGGAVNITAGAAAGGTNAGGDVNLAAGAAASTGIPGLVKFNGNASLICATATPATAVDAVFFVATRPMIVTSVSQVHSVAAGGASTLQVTKDSTTAAPGAGTDLLSAAFNLNATANTVQVGALVTTVATVTMAAGDRLAFDFADAIQSSAGVVITACMAPL